MQCDHPDCSESIAHMVKDHITAHSMVAVLQKVDQAGYSFFQCEEGQEREFVRYQHFHCSHTCMKENMRQCLSQHYTEEKLHSIPNGGGTTRMHTIILRGNVSCLVCAAPLINQAYRFCLTQSTPVNYIPDTSNHMFGEWCCSLNHALESALYTIESLEEFILSAV